MKHINIILLSFLLGACSVEDKDPEIIKPYFIDDGKTTSPSTPTTPVNTTVSLVAYYPFNGNAKDESGNANHGNVKAVYLAPDRFGVADKAAKFSDGSSIVVPNSSTLKLTNAFTFSMWVKMLSTTGRNGNGATTANSEQCIFTKNCDNGHLRCAIYPQANGTFWLETYANDGFKSTIPFQINQWSMISIVYDGSTLKHYVDGKLNASKAISMNLNLTNTNDLIIGNMGCFGYYFNGLIDDFRVYNRALTDAEVVKIYSSEKP